MEGESLLPVIDGAEPSYDTVITEKEMRGEDALRLGFRTDEWKFLYDGKTDDELLYDLTSDPAESTNVVAEHPDVRDGFRDRLKTRFERIEATSRDVDVPEVEDEEGVEEQLRALGYK
jgi:hypothetical protein